MTLVRALRRTATFPAVRRLLRSRLPYPHPPILSPTPASRQGGPDAERGRPPRTGVRQKVSRRLLPPLFVMFVLSFLDRTNVALVKSHLATDAGSTPPPSGSAPASSSSATPCSACPPTWCSTGSEHAAGSRPSCCVWGLLSARWDLVDSPASFYRCASCSAPRRPGSSPASSSTSPTGSRPRTAARPPACSSPPSRSPASSATPSAAASSDCTASPGSRAGSGCSSSRARPPSRSPSPCRGCSPTARNRPAGSRPTSGRCSPTASPPRTVPGAEAREPRRVRADRSATAACCA